MFILKRDNNPILNLIAAKAAFFFFIAFFLIGCNETTTVSPAKTDKFVFFKSVETGSEPSEIFYDKNTGLFHVFCNGHDLDFNGIKNENDESPSWWVIDKNDIEHPQKKLEFEFGNIGIPFRPAFDLSDNLLFFSQKGKIKKYNISNFTFIEDIGDYYADALSKKGDLLFLSVTPIFNGEGKVIVYDIKKKKEIMIIPAGINTKQTLFFTKNNKNILAILSEGSGILNSDLQFVELKADTFEILKSYNSLGKTGNHISMNEQNLILTFNYSHEIMIFNLTTMMLTKTLSVGTTEYNGPREAIFNKNQIIVSTYNNDIRIFDYLSGNLLQTLSFDTKAEGVCVAPNEYLLVANELMPDYKPNNKVSIFTIE